MSPLLAMTEIKHFAVRKGILGVDLDRLIVGGLRTPLIILELDNEGEVGIIGSYHWVLLYAFM
jgi:hypothetical protein